MASMESQIFCTLIFICCLAVAIRICLQKQKNTRIIMILAGYFLADAALVVMSVSKQKWVTLYNFV
jgi:hypothetical protein